jgi:TPP-dependent pyruvate/acetoin dehydrogenase alpha subunit
MIKNLEQYPIVNEVLWDKHGLIGFEKTIADHWEAGRIKGPVHLSGGNEDQLLEIGKRIKSTDWVFSTWRSHYHALIKGVPSEWLEQEILEGLSNYRVNDIHPLISLAHGNMPSNCSINLGDNIVKYKQIFIYI